MKLTMTQRLGGNVNDPPTYARPPTPPGPPRAAPTQYKIIVVPTREGWRYIIQTRRGTHKSWVDLAPFRPFTSRAEAERYVTELQK